MILVLPINCGLIMSDLLFIGRSEGLVEAHGEALWYFVALLNVLCYSCMIIDEQV